MCVCVYVLSTTPRMSSSRRPVSPSSPVTCMSPSANRALPPARDRIQETSRLDLVVQWLREFPDSAQTVQHCCRRLFLEGTEATIHMENITSGPAAVEGILAGLDRHLMDPRVCTWACAALAVIVRAERHFQKLAGARAVPMALSALELHPGNPDSSRYALGALLLLVLKCEQEGRGQGVGIVSGHMWRSCGPCICGGGTLMLTHTDTHRLLHVHGWIHVSIISLVLTRTHTHALVCMHASICNLYTRANT